MKLLFPLFSLVAALLGAHPALAADALRLEIATVSGVDRHEGWLPYPGYLAIALESNGMHISSSSRLNVGERGQRLEARNAFLQYKGRRGSVYDYEAGILLGIGDARVSFPVSIDASSIGKGRAVVTVTPPLASLFPDEVRARIETKLQLVADANVQRRLVEYLDNMAKQAGKGTPQSPMAEALLLDAYGKTAAHGVGPSGDVGDALPLSDQWMLIVTLIIWIVMPALILSLRFIRARRQ